jgi:transposase-like protein
MTMAKPATILEFLKQFPDDDTCLDHLMRTTHGEHVTCPACAKRGKFHRIRKRPVYECAWCGHQISPMVGTPFEKSRTPLQKWFYAMYLFTTLRHGVPAKELQRQLGVTYKTAWRIGQEIRKYMGDVDGDFPLSGHVEIDETLIGGENRGGGQRCKMANKSVVFGMVERGGDIMTEVIADTTRARVVPLIERHVRRGAAVSTDEHRVYPLLDFNGYRHDAVNHRAKEYVRGEAHTNTIEGFWSILQRAVRGMHVHVSRQHLDKYLKEFEFRINLRRALHLMFPRLVASFACCPHPRAVGALPFRT